MKPQPLTIAVPDEDLRDLRERLIRTRWPADFANDDWRYGTNRDYLRDLVNYWIDGYDWRLQEAGINSFANYRVSLGGLPIHYIHEPGVGPAPLPLILSHGWPWVFWDYHKVIRPLADPGSHGGDPADAFDVVVPSLPGFGFSSPLERPGITFVDTADLWVELMQGVLGYRHFGAAGGDWGALITEQLGHKYADSVVGVHINIMVPLDFHRVGMPPASAYAAEERAQYEHNTRVVAEESGYNLLQSTRPQTISYALEDSPAALCAWILEKRRAWSDCDGDVERRFTRDELLTVMTLYWVTRTSGTSARYYYELRRAPWRPAHDRKPVVQAPTGIAVFPKELVILPRAWAEEYYNLARWTQMAAGGHFAPMEEPDALIADLREFFRPLR